MNKGFVNSTFHILHSRNYREVKLNKRCVKYTSFVLGQPALLSGSLLLMGWNKATTQRRDDGSMTTN